MHPRQLLAIVLLYNSKTLILFYIKFMSNHDTTDKNPRRAGRPKGRKNKKTMISAAKGVGKGLMPHEILLMIARGENIMGDDHKPPTLEQRIEAARAVAPYYVPKLAAIEHKVESTVQHVVSAKPLTELEWEQKYGQGDVIELDA